MLNNGWLGEAGGYPDARNIHYVQLINQPPAD